MRAVSLWQPWASAVVLGPKRIETRGWSTDYRGPLLIHAAKRKVISEIVPLLKGREWHVALEKLGGTLGHSDIFDYLPFGAIIGKVDLVDCKRTEDITEAERRREYGRFLYMYYVEEQLGDYRPGRFGWLLQNPIRFKEPIPWVGRQLFFNVPDDVLPAEARGGAALG